MFGLPNPYTLLIGAGVGIAIISGAFVTGVRYEKRKGEANALRIELAIANDDLAKAKQAALDAETAQNDLEDAAAKDAVTLAAIKEELRKAEEDAANAPPPEPGKCPANSPPRLGVGGVKRLHRLVE